MGFYLSKTNEFDFQRTEKHLDGRSKKKQKQSPVSLPCCPLNLPSSLQPASLLISPAAINNNILIAFISPKLRASGGWVRHEETDKNSPLARLILAPEP